LLAAGCLAASAPGAARAQGVAVRDAQARFEEGLDRVKSGDFEAARLSFAQAYTVIHRPSILWNLALAEEKTGHLVEALGHFKQVARDPAAEGGDRDVAERHAAALGARTGHIAVEAPPGAVLTVDGDPHELVAPLSEAIDVAPGHHVVSAMLPDVRKTLEVDAAAGQLARVNFVLAEATGPAAPKPAPAPPAPGPKLDEPVPIDPEADRRARSQRTARIATTVALGGAAAVAASLGIVFGVESRQDANAAGSLRSAPEWTTSWCYGPAGATHPGCGALSGNVAAQNRDAIASDALYVGAGVLAVGAVATWFLFPTREGQAPPVSTGVWIVPAVGTRGAGLAGGVRF
jgi:hypothetical protein